MSEARSLREIVGTRIRAARQARGLSAPALAAALRWPLDTLLNYEYGRRPLQLDRLEKIAAALEMAPSALLIEDAMTATLVTRLAKDSDLAREVHFFVAALEAEGEQLDDATHAANEQDHHPSARGSHRA
jgi:transcriptional regulator with XRE-family HTH domain